MRRASRASACLLVAGLMLLALAPSAPAHPARWHATANSDGTPRLGKAPPARLWTERQGFWVHQHATVFNVYAAVRSPRLRHWLARSVRTWSDHTVLEMQFVDSPAAANVVVHDGFYGPRVLAAWTRVCGKCQMAYVYFNRTRLSPVLSPPNDPRAGAVVCQELGHVAGLWHGGGDCMSFGYHRTYTYGVGAANARLVNYAYRHVPAGLPSRLRGIATGS